MDIKITQKEMGKCLLFGGETRRALDPCSLKVLFILSDKVMKHGRCFYIENGQHRAVVSTSLRAWAVCVCVCVCVCARARARASVRLF